jgi:flagellar biosynthesis/type III secretory pathway M-ring protein FliF/YscJ
MSTEVAAAVLALAGVAAVVAVAWVFYRIGRAEDREREREQAEAAARRAEEPEDEHRSPGLARERRRPLPPRRP